MAHAKSSANSLSTLELAARWCALSALGSRRLRAAAGSADELVALWRLHDSPALSAKNYDALGQWLDHLGGVLFRFSEQFPATLKAIPDPPAAIFFLGELAALSQPRVAIVGSRAASHSGVALARTLAGDLGDSGVLVVSGLAQGIDYAAHAGALQRNRPTAAILGSGLDNLYPRRHKPLVQEILATGGVLLSEYAPWVAPHKSSFPARNRLISGLAAGVVVVQAAQRSGSLITARLAAEQGREVMAVPGPPGSPVSAGCNLLLREGAALIENAQDVFAALGWDRSVEPTPAQLIGPQAEPQELPSGSTEPDEGAMRVLDSLDSVPLSLEELTQFIGLPAGELERALLRLQLSGLVQVTPQGYIRAAPRRPSRGLES